MIKPWLNMSYWSIDRNIIHTLRHKNCPESTEAFCSGKKYGILAEHDKNIDKIKKW